MPTDNRVKALRVPPSALDAAQTHRPFRILSLTGGGYRGLFTAQTLVELCERARYTGRLDSTFDIFGGTSIGGVMACALSVGVPPRRVLDAIDANGPMVFVKKRQRTLRRVFFGTLYDSDNLGKAIDDCLGDQARTKLKDIETGLIVPAVDWEKGTVQLFMSGAFGKAHASGVTLKDVCLATSAAPTYFRPHLVDGAAMLDGGLAANNPDTLILLELARRWPEQIPNAQMLSIGTAGADRVRLSHQADKSGLAWASELAVYMMTVQERTAQMQAQRMLGKSRYLRINHLPAQGTPAFENMDLADETSRAQLLAAATHTAQSAYRKHKAFVDRMLAQRP